MLPAEVLAAVRRIEIKTKSLIDSIMGGEYRSVFKGNGMEFAEVRQYMEGDDIRSIDWNVTARTGEPYVKRMMEERELIVYLMVDVSASGNFGTKKQFKSEMMAELAALIAFSAIKNNDRVGLILFTDRIEKVIPPKKGRNHVLHLIREMLYFKPEGTGTNINGALEHLNRIQKKRSVVFTISDFRDTGFQKLLKVTARRHDVIAVSVDDPREYELPNMGFVELLDPETGEPTLIDTGSKSVRNEFARRSQEFLVNRDEVLQSAGIELLTVTTEKGYIDPLLKFFQKREKRR